MGDWREGIESEMNSAVMEEILCNIFDCIGPHGKVEDIRHHVSELEVASVQSYQDAGMMTHDRGVVIRANGHEFRVTIHEARW